MAASRVLATIAFVKVAPSSYVPHKPQSRRLLKWLPLVIGALGVLGVIGFLWLWQGKPLSMAAAYWSLANLAAVTFYFVAEFIRPRRRRFASWSRLPLLARVALPVSVGALTLYLGFLSCAR